MGLVRRAPIRSCSLSLDDARQLFLQLQACVVRAAEIHAAAIQRPDDVTQEEFEEFITNIKKDYIITVVINGKNGESLIETDEKIFYSQNLPDSIINIYFTSSSTYKARNNNLGPPNSFFLNIDFTKPPLLDWRNPISGATPNQSEISVEGQDETWIAGVFETINRKINNRRSKRDWLHRPFVFDFGLWLLGFPFGFYISWLSIPVFSLLFETSNFLQTAASVYSFLLGLSLYRVFFGYTKWAFPMLELLDNRNLAAKHRRWWTAVTASLVAGLILLLIDLPFSS